MWFCVRELQEYHLHSVANRVIVADVRGTQSHLLKLSSTFHQILPITIILQTCSETKESTHIADQLRRKKLVSVRLVQTSNDSFNNINDNLLINFFSIQYVKQNQGMISITIVPDVLIASNPCFGPMTFVRLTGGIELCPLAEFGV